MHQLENKSRKSGKENCFLFIQRHWFFKFWTNPTLYCSHLFEMPAFPRCIILIADPNLGNVSNVAHLNLRKKLLIHSFFVHVYPLLHSFIHPSIHSFIHSFFHVWLHCNVCDDVYPMISAILCLYIWVPYQNNFLLRFVQNMQILIIVFQWRGYKLSQHITIAC